MDSLTIDLALTGMATLGLGARDGHTDLLSISLSTVDETGHDYGPDSREMHDMLLRLDAYLGWFLDSLATTVPAGNTMLVLAADHGVQPIPEQAPAAPATATVRVWPGSIVRGLARTLRERWRTDFGVRFDYGVVIADVAALQARGVDTDSLSRALAHELAAEPYVERVFTPRSLAVAPVADPLASRWRHTIPAGLGWLAAVTAHRGIYWGTWPVGADHGTPWPSDVGIPIVFWGGGVAAGTVTRPVRSVDIAPTLARRLGILPTERVDGVVLPEVARATR
jgi:arylsulfatase A-like enzyme